MSKREYYIHLNCIPGCKETSFSVVPNMRERAEAMARYAKNPWRCFRHGKPDEVLSADNAKTTATVVVCEETYGKFWREEGQERGGNGISYGPGFRAIAKDFPAGTRLTITAVVETPEESEATR
ncbi:hypothetical protein [Amycolatopsis sp. NPDC051372]|uniref:hypothetical protein n=1 Tax=Amycolatopsis sp. NPDC051372 TaxID=3155669 RepID=UPI00341A6DC0